MTEWLIEDDVPVAKETRGRKYKYPFEQMKVGQSVFIPEPYDKSATARASAYAKKSIHYVWKCKDGEVIDPPQGSGPEALRAAIRGKDGHWEPIGRKHFTTRSEPGGVRIHRLEDIPLTDYYEVPAFPGVKFLRD